jgi:hypothetical protein
MENKTKKEEFIKRLHKIDERFSTVLAWEDNLDSSKSKILMTPATEFYRLYKGEVEKLIIENKELKDTLSKINKLSKLLKEEE